LGERMVGRPICALGFEPVLFVGRPCDLAGCAVSTNPSVLLADGSPACYRARFDGGVSEVRAIGLDIHRGFCEVAIREEGVTRSVGRVLATPAALELSAGSLGADGWVAFEVSGNAAEIARILEGARRACRGRQSRGHGHSSGPREDGPS